MTTVIENMPAKDRLLATLDTHINKQAIAPDLAREKALEVLSKIEFPTTKNEEWKYSNTKPILDFDFHPGIFGDISSEQIAPFIFSKTANVLVFVNGVYSEELSNINETSAAAYLGSLSNAHLTHAAIIKKHFANYAKVENEAFTALNTAYSTDGAFIFVPEKTVIKEPVQLLFINKTSDQALISQPRVLVVCETNSQVKIIESYHSIETETAFTNAVTEIVCQANSFVDHYKIQLENNRSYHIGTTQVYQEKSSVFTSFVITLNGAFVRNNLTAVLDAEGIESHLFGLYLPNQKQHVDNHTLVDHQKPHCNSNELYKGIIDDHATAVFNGKIFVRVDAQKTNAFQSNKNILLSDFARMDSKPQLEIFADDVKCSHGSSTGQFDEDALFYMRARGIGQEQGKNLLMYAFASEVIDAVKIPELKEYLYQLLSVRLHHDFS